MLEQLADPLGAVDDEVGPVEQLLGRLHALHRHLHHGGAVLGQAVEGVERGEVAPVVAEEAGLALSRGRLG